MQNIFKRDIAKARIEHAVSEKELDCFKHGIMIAR